MGACCARLRLTVNSSATAHEAIGLLGNANAPIVVLARGEVSKALQVKAHRISAAARQKIEAAGGSIEILPWVVEKNLPRS